MELTLRKIKKEDKDELLNMLKEYEKCELLPGIDRYEGIRNFEKLKDLDFELWLEEQIANETDENLPEDFSPQTVYLAVNERDNIIGMTTLRWKEVPALVKYGGYIGYSIRPSQRGKGYARQILMLALDKMWEQGRNRVLVCCKDFNTPSKSTIESCGGKYDSTYYNAIDGYNHLRYWIYKDNLLEE